MQWLNAKWILGLIGIAVFSLATLLLHQSPLESSVGTADQTIVESTDEIPSNLRRMRILVSNDDGIQSPGLIALVKTLSKNADVVVCAPDSNRSGAGQSVPSLNRPMNIQVAKVDGAETAVAVSGSPADAVSYGIIELGKEKPFDLVISGINSSANVGGQTHSSGTIGAAMEGVYRGVPSVAVSHGGPRKRNYLFAAEFTTRFIEKLMAEGATQGIVYSINVPTSDAAEIKGVAIRPMGGTQISILGYRTLEEQNGSKKVRTNLKFETSGPKGSDCESFFDGYITITPLKFDWTAVETIRKMEKWNLKAR